jgi:hypothetical protein
LADPSSFSDDWLGKLATAVVAMPLAAFVTWLLNRRAQNANIVSMIVTASGGLCERLEAECARVTGECTALRGEVGDLRDQHRKCESRLDDLEREKRELRAQIDGLVTSAPPATYGADHAAQAERVGRAAQSRQKGEDK